MLTSVDMKTTRSVV